MNACGGKATLKDLPYPFADIAGEYGIKTKNLNEEGFARLGKLRDRAMDAIRDEQDVTGKAVTPERKEAILRSLLVKTTNNTFSANKHVFEMDSFMDLPGTQDEKQQAVELLTSQGAMVTPANVFTMLKAIRAKRGTK